MIVCKLVIFVFIINILAGLIVFVAVVNIGKNLGKVVDVSKIVLYLLILVWEDKVFIICVLLV